LTSNGLLKSGDFRRLNQSINQSKHISIAPYVASESAKRGDMRRNFTAFYQQ